LSNADASAQSKSRMPARVTVTMLPKGPDAISTSHLAPAAVSAAVGGKTAFSFGRLGDGKQSSGKEGDTW
jgi:hypothetical protein